jgi:hypothetical protein
MNVFTTIYKDQYHQTLRALRFATLQKLAGDNAGKFECFRPVVGGLTTQRSEQDRKAEFVQLLIDMHLAGVNFDSLPTGCSCEDIAGNLCNTASEGFAALLAGINSIGG